MHIQTHDAYRHSKCIWWKTSAYIHFDTMYLCTDCADLTFPEDK